MLQNTTFLSTVYNLSTMPRTISRDMRKAYELRGTLSPISINLTRNIIRRCNDIVAKGWFKSRQEFLRYCIVKGLVELNGYKI